MNPQTLRIEGGLLSPDFLERIHEMPGQRAAEFGLDANRPLVDEVSAIYADARVYWEAFQRRLAHADGESITTVTREQWVIPLLELLGYQLVFQRKAPEADGSSFPISHRASPDDNAPPVHIVGADQEMGNRPPAGRGTMSPHALVQDYLNRTDHLWGIVTNGLTLRLLRDSTVFTRPAYIEFDLHQLMQGEHLDEFILFYRLAHRTRLPRTLADAPQCLLERYHQQAIEQGGRIRDGLRDAVEQAILTFANGFLRHPANTAFVQALANQHLSAEAFYQQLLRLIYRLLFLMVSEERNLLASRKPQHAVAAEIYRSHYSIMRLRQLVDVPSAYTRHSDLWHGLRVVFRCLQDEKFGPLLALPALNGELFAPLALDDLSLHNRDLLSALWHLSNYRDETARIIRRVNYSALDVEELGSVYESLLEFHPRLTLGDGLPSFTLARESAERRSTGSHYTPPELVGPLVKHALDPVLKSRLSAAKTPAEKERAVLSIKVCDPACGSGHFLLAAARHLGKELARIRSGEEEPAPDQLREAVREVVTHCIYGVDKNPLAVELCRVALWLESHAEDKPLTFLDHRIRCGDSLVGLSDLQSLACGIPDEAFQPVAGDDRAAARLAKARNASERRETLFHYAFAQQLRQFAAELQRLDGLSEDTIEQVRSKAEGYQHITQSAEFHKLQLASHIWTAAFIQSFPGNAGAPVTTEALRTALNTSRPPDARLAGWIQATAHQKAFFHWPLAFPEVLASGGFDVFLGNPPFMGGLKISSNFGPRYRHWLECAFEGFAGTADLCAAFFRRAFSLLKPGGRLGMIATNTLGQGDTREGGLAVILRQGGVITFARRFVKWPGQANVEVNLVAIHKPDHSPLAIRYSPVLDDQPVPFISSRLDAEPEEEPRRLRQNQDKAFQGDIVRGLGFVLEPAEAEALLAKDPRNADCLFPYLNGEDLNTDPEQKPSRYVICFHDWPLERARQYPDLLRIVEERVKPERERLRNRDDQRDREHWWLFARYRGDMRRAIAPLRRVLARSRVSELHALAFVPKNYVYGDATVVFAFDDYFHFALLQSNVHEAWLRRNASTMRTDIRYTPTDCFETFPFPPSPAAEARAEAERLGEAYHEHRRQTMLARQLGLTKTYNLFHNPQCADADIVRLRELHAALDRAILACYGWTDLDPGHDFHPNDRGQTRYTISPAARRELLHRLLALNLETAAREAGAATRSESHDR